MINQLKVCYSIYDGETTYTLHLIKIDSFGKAVWKTILNQWLQLEILSRFNTIDGLWIL